MVAYTVEMVGERLARLEMRNRTLRTTSFVALLLSLVCVLGMVAVFALDAKGRAKPKDHGRLPDIIEAKAFYVVNDDGERLAALTRIGGEPYLILDREGGRRGGMLCSSYLTLCDEKREPRVGLGMLKGNASLTILSENGVERVSISDEADAGVVRIRDGQGRCRAMLNVVNGDPSLILADSRGVMRAMMNCVGNIPELMLWAEDGDSRLWLQVVGGTGRIGVRDDEGRQSWMRPQ